MILLAIISICYYYFFLVTNEMAIQEFYFFLLFYTSSGNKLSGVLCCNYLIQMTILDYMAIKYIIVFGCTRSLLSLSLDGYLNILIVSDDISLQFWSITGNVIVEADFGCWLQFFVYIEL